GHHRRPGGPAGGRPAAARRDRAAAGRGTGGDRRGGGGPPAGPRPAGGAATGRPGRVVREDPRRPRRGRRGPVARRPVRRLPAGAVRQRTRPGEGGRAGRGDPVRGVPPHHGAGRGVRPVSGGVRVIVEADGGARGNPGPAGWGAVVRDADTGRVLR